MPKDSTMMDTGKTVVYVIFYFPFQKGKTNTEGKYQYHGQGSLHSPSGVYEGEWVYDQKEGNGSMKYPNGKEYKGLWKRNEYHGQGSLTYTGGTILSYVGEWQYHRKTGSGVMKLTNGDTYEGHFKDNFVSWNSFY